MVMVYKESPEVDSLILDNQHPDVIISTLMWCRQKNAAISWQFMLLKMTVRFM
jgi:hypothetical protein